LRFLFPIARDGTGRVHSAAGSLGDDVRRGRARPFRRCARRGGAQEGGVMRGLLRLLFAGDFREGVAVGRRWLAAPRLVWRHRARRGARVLAIAAAILIGGIVAVAAHRARLSSHEPTLLLRDRHGRFLAAVGERKDGEYGYWPIEELPPRVVAATLALEDRRFWKHPGVDPIAASRAAVQNVLRLRRISGASTVAMQLARLEHPESRTYLHKAIEAVTAIFLVG